MKKRVLSLLMALALCFSVLSAAALAEEPADGESNVSVLAVPSANAEDKPQGDGTESNPYLIGAVNELKWFRDTVNGGETDICAKLTADISYKRYVSNPEPKWEPIGTEENRYTGTFDGNGFRISMDCLVNNKDAADEITDWGLFGYIGSAGKVQDLNVDIQNLGRNYKALNATRIGMLAASNAGTVERCTAINSYQFYVSGTVGLLVYQNDGTVQDCIAKVGFSYDNLGSVGGVAYRNNGTVRSCFFSACGLASVGGWMNNHAFAFEKGDGSSVQNCYYRYGCPNEDNTEGVTQLWNSEVEAGKATVMLNNDGDEQGSKTDPWRIDSNQDRRDPSLSKADSRVRYDSESQQYVIEGKPHLHGDVEFTKVTALSDITAGGRYCVDGDISLDSTWSVVGDVTLCLNGQTITATPDITAISLNHLAGLTLLDCSRDNTGKITGGKRGVWAGGKFIMQGGEITGNKTGIYALTDISLGGKAKVVGNNQNILLNNGSLIYFDALDASAKFGISVVNQDTLGEGDRKAVTDTTGGRYFGQLFADGFNEDGTGFELYLDGDTVMLGKQSVHTHCICGGENTNQGHASHSDVTFKPWTETGSLPESGNYYLTRNVTLTGYANLTDANICLNGYTVTLPDSDKLIQVSADNKGSLTDCIGNGTITGNSIFIENGGKIDLYGGSISGTAVEIDSSGGTFNMYGGKITDNKTTAVIGNCSNTYINMYGGKITGNESAGNGGGVCISDGCTFTMSGGEISGNKADGNGGGVYAGGVFNISGSANITGNTVNGSDNNVYLPDGKTITVTGEPEQIIGFTTAAVPADGIPVKFAVGGNSYVIQETDTAHFIPDAGSVYKSIYRSDGAMYLSLQPHEHPVIPGGTGDVIWVSVTDEDELRRIAPAMPDTYYYLASDIKLAAGTWEPADGTVLDLNGHSIIAQGDFDTIMVGSGVNFTLTDCKGGNENYGSITHEMKDRYTKRLGCGVNVYFDGHFTMYGGAIAGNWANNKAGAGVYVSGDAYFTMLGGDISGNVVPTTMSNNGGGIYTVGETKIGGSACIMRNTALTGGGVYVNGGTLTLEGNAKVTGNSATNYRNGIFVSEYGKLCVSGGVQVTENSNGSNVWLDGKDGINPISVVGELTDSAAIGVSLPQNILKNIDDNNFVTIAAAETDDRIKSGSFINENGSAYSVIVSNSGKTAKLGTHEHEWQYKLSSDGTAITAKCSNENCSANGGSMKIKAPDESTLTYDGSEKPVITEGSFNTGAVPEITYKVYKNGEFTALPEGETVPVNAGGYEVSLTVEGVTAALEYTIAKGTLKVSDFNVTLPTDLTYDGNSKTATVTSDKIDSKYIEVSYWTKNEQGMFAYAFDTRDADTYFVRIEVTTNPNYAEIEGRITDEDNWKFTVLPTDKYTVNIPEDWSRGTEIIEGSTFDKALTSITKNGEYAVTATGANDEKLFGRFSWYTDDACTKPVDEKAVIDKAAGNTVKLYWKFVFTDEYQKNNYVTKDEIGSVDVKIVDGPKQELAFYDRSLDKVTEGLAEYGSNPFPLYVMNKTTDGGNITYSNSNPDVAKTDIDKDGNITVTVCGVGTAVITATAAMVPGKYAKTTATYTLTVNKGNWGEWVQVGMPTASIYNEKPQTPELLGYNSGDYSVVTYLYSATNAAVGSSEYKIWDINNPPQLNAGTYYMYAIIGETANYNRFITKIYTFEVLKAFAVKFLPTNLTAAYGQKLSDIQLTNPEGNAPGTWSWINGDESVGGASGEPKIFKAKFTPDDTDNYEIEDDVELEVTVNKAAAPVLEDVAVSQKYIIPSGTVMVGNIMPSDAGQLTYTPGSASTTGSVAVSSWSANVDTGEVSYTLSGGAPGDTVTLPVTVSSANYDDTVVKVVITLTPKNEQAAFTVTGNTTVVYGQTLQLGTDGGSGTGAVTYTVTGGTGEATIDPVTGILTPVKFGTVNVTATKAGDDNYSEITSAPFVITITQAKTIGEPKYTAITAGGKKLKDAVLTADGSTLKPNEGKLEWVDANGSALPDDTAVEANKTYKWRFTPADDNYTVLTGEAELYHVSYGGGGGGGTTRYTVSFDTNGGSELPKQTVARNNSIKEPAAPTKEGFVFAGWYTDEALKTKYDFSAKVTKNITLYAAWTEKDDSENRLILTIGEKDALVFGTVKTNDVAPKIVNDRTMLPARFVAENLGASVDWDDENKLVTIIGKNIKTGEETTLLIYIGSDVAYVNGKEVKLDSPAFIENDRTYTPIRFISEELGASVEWIESEQKVVISK